MKKIILLWLVLLLFSSIVTAKQVDKSAQETVFEGNLAYTTHSKGIVGQHPHTISSTQEATISFEPISEESSYDLCFDFGVNRDAVIINKVDKKGLFGLFNEDLKQIKKKDDLVCVKSFSATDETEFGFKARYIGRGLLKYDIYILPSKYKMDFEDADKAGDLIILDPYIIGELNESDRTVLYYSFDNTSSSTVDDVDLFSFTEYNHVENTTCGPGPIHCPLRTVEINESYLTNWTAWVYYSGIFEWTYKVEFEYIDGTKRNETQAINNAGWHVYTLINPQDTPVVRVRTWAYNSNPAGNSNAQTENITGNGSKVSPIQTTYVYRAGNFYAGYAFNSIKSSDDIFNSYDGTDANVSYTGLGAYFNGSYSSIAIPQINLSGTYSIATRLKADNYTPDNHYILGNNATAAYNNLRLLNDGRIILESQTNSDQCTSLTAIDDNDWHDLVVSVNSQTCTFYLDGEELGASDSSITDDVLITDIGEGNKLYYWNGTIEYLYIHNDTLSQDEVTRLHNKGQFGPGVDNSANSSMNYTGNDYLLTSITGTEGSYSIAAWVYPKTYSNQAIFDERDSGLDGIALYYSSAQEWIFIHDGIAVRYPVTYNQWSHIAATYDYTTMKLYINGELVNSTTDADNTSISNYARIGALYTGGTSYSLNGYIDELLFYNYAIDADDVQILYGGFNASLSLTFLNEETNLPVENVSVEIITDAVSVNSSTTDGELFLNTLPLGLVTIRYDSTGYYERFYYVNLTNESNTELTLYLVNETNASEITATVYDSSGADTIEDAYIRYLRYDVSTNTYNIVGMAKTDFQGEAKLYLVKNSEFYKFMIYYPFNTLLQTTQPTYVYDDNLNFQVVTTTLPGETFDEVMGISYNLEFNNATNNFRYDFSNVDGDDVTSKLEVYKVNALGSTLVNSSNTTGASGTILLTVPEVNGTTYIAKASVVIDNDDQVVATKDHTFVAEDPFGLFGVFAVVILTIVFAFIGYFSISVMLILVPLPLIFASSSVLGIVNIGTQIAILIEIIAVMLAVIIKK